MSPADVVYFNGEICTMKGDQPEYVEVVAVKDGRIVYAGPKSGSSAFEGPNTEKRDLQGKFMCPGFICAHGHFVMYIHTSLDANLVGVKNIPELLARLKEHEKTLAPGDRLVGMGYRAEQLEEKRHPTIEELDSVSSTREIAIQDGSGHQGVINSATAKLLGVTKGSPDPEGGKWFRREDGTFDGHAAEHAIMQVMASRAQLRPDQIAKGLERAHHTWLSNGQTTASELGLGLSGDDIEVVKHLLRENMLKVDLVIFAKWAQSEKIMEVGYHVGRHYRENYQEEIEKLLSDHPDLDKRYIRHARLAGVKFWLDGSADTAYMSKPFTHLPPNVTDPHFCGMRVDGQDQVDAAFTKYWKSERQIAAHVNGDEAIDSLLTAAEKAAKEQGMADHRPVFQHCTMLRPDQIKRMKAVGGIPSFTFGAFYGMAGYAKTLWGAEREKWMTPANSVLKSGNIFTINHDTPAGMGPNLLLAMWNAVNRVILQGGVVGPEERVTTYQALQGITSHVAYQHHEERLKGTIEVGKLGDLVILDKNVLKVDPMNIRDVQVLESIKEGKTVFKKE